MMLININKTSRAGIICQLPDCVCDLAFAIEKLPVFTFTNFEKMYVKNRGASDSVSFAFDEYISELKTEGRIGTAVSYQCAKRSLDEFKNDLRLADITPALLNKYENWMLEAGNSSTTVGIYLRSLRTIFNRADVDKSLYPFGTDKSKYKIPTGRNIKKALTIEEVSRIFKYEVVPGSITEMAKDYWIFIYLCNGLNVKDLCLLKRKDINGDFLSFERAKTKRTRKDGNRISVSLKPEAKAIIKKWGQRSISPDSYVFPHLHKSMTPERERQIVQQLTHVINRHMKEIAKDQKIKKEVTTYFARHSFATVLKRSGASIEFISEALGHSDVKTTKNYLDSFEKETLQKTTDALTAFAN
jgi:integrase/recombinase XerD